MAEQDWIDGLICFCNRRQIDSDVIDGVEAAWNGLRGDRPYPARAEIDPLAFRNWLPYLSIVELHEAPFRVRYRLVGTEVARFSGEDFSGKWLHETDWGEKSQQLNRMLYQRVFDERAPIFGLSQLTWQGRSDHFFQWALFPLGPADGGVTHCLSADDFTRIAEPSGLLRESEGEDGGNDNA
ncbi:PAS domain-containing protein [Dongia sp.]|uniref:PAS domain-containing protein n=1 Tax=Dongia sp. TaxID=1977262 RepID=UPI0035B4F270